MFPHGKQAEAVFQKWPGLCLVLAAELGRVRVTQVVLVLKVWKGHREQLSFALYGQARVPEASTGEATGESAAQVQQGTPEFSELPVLWADHQEQPQVWSGASLSLESKLCVPRVEPGK